MARVKKKDWENLSASNIEKVITLLNGDSPITKKEACEILNIAYNTARLQKIVTEYEERKAYTATRKAKLRGKAATDDEIKSAVTEYLSGDPVSSIAKGLYRSASFVKNLIERVGVPSKPASAEERTGVAYLPDECCSEEFNKGEIVWSARHHSPAIVDYELSVDYQAERAGFFDVNYEKKYGSKCYAIYVLQPVQQSEDVWMQVPNVGGFSAYSLAYDLGSLRHLEKYGVDLTKI